MGKSIDRHKVNKRKLIGNIRKKKKHELESQSKFKFPVSNHMVIPVEDQKENEDEDESENGLVAELPFMGNYSEPNLCIPLGPMLKNLQIEAPENENESDNLKNGFQTPPPS